MTSRRSRILGLLGTLAAALVLAGAPLALGAFSDPASGGPMTISSSTLAPPKGLNVTQPNCRSNKGVELALVWTATASSYATSYAVERATSSSGPFTTVASVSAAQTSYTDSSGSLAYSTTYYYRVSTAYRSWSAASGVDSIKTLSRYCL